MADFPTTAPRGNATEGTAHFSCCGVDITAPAAGQGAEFVLSLTRDHGTGVGVHLCNSYTLSLATKDAAYRDLLNRDVNLPDGTPLAWVGARRTGNRVRPTRGPGLLWEVMRASVPHGSRHVLYGASPETIERLARRLSEKIPGLQIAGAISPPFRDLTGAEEDEFVAEMARLRPAYVWVGLGTPRQDVFVAKMAARAPAVFIAVGAAFDFAAGSKREAPGFLHASGFEWLYRFASEPRRLWKRYTLGNAIFLREVAVEEWHRMRARS
jgi:N-acetylglucosaminyldiphosphoundecaprenol N-acetyl-beta-D-mannosaminyltransferase